MKRQKEIKNKKYKHKEKQINNKKDNVLLPCQKFRIFPAKKPLF